MRWRVVVAATLFGAVLSGLFALTANWVTEDYEHVIIEEILGAYARDVAAHLDDKDAAKLPRSDALSIWLRQMDGSGGVPAALATLPPGIHELENVDEADEQHIAVYDLGERRLYVVLGLAAIERREGYLASVMAGILVLGTAASGWLGWLLAGRITGPVGRLAREVDGRRPDHGLAPLAPQFADDELGMLARAFDRYHERLLAQVERERAFAAEASHGLRTPLAVIRGAAEVLIDDASIAPATRERVRRIERGAATLADLLDGLLAVARAATPERIVLQPVSLAELMEGALGEQLGLLQSAGLLPVRVGRDPATAEVEVALREAQVALRIVLRTFAESAAPGDLRWACVDGGIELRSGAAPLSRFSNADLASDRFVGLGLVGRLCTRLGWLLALGEDGDSRLVFARLRFDARAPDGAPIARAT